MDAVVKGICDSVRKLCLKLKPQNNPTSLILVIGKAYQGKSSLLRQSDLSLYSSEYTDIYYNRLGIIIEINEAQFVDNNIPFSYLIKKLNNCHRALKITGLIITIDINELLGESYLVIERLKEHARFINNFTRESNTRLFSAIIFTKVDSLAGFLEYFQNEHETDIKKQLGFSIFNNTQKNKLVESFKDQYDSFIEMLSQKIIHKIHPVRSNLKRGLIREFPLQLASLKNAIQLLIQNIALSKISLEAIYFTSAEQGGVSLDRVTRKIQNQFSLVVRDSFVQATNYQGFFISGAIRNIQLQTKYNYSFSPILYKAAIGTTLSITAAGFLWLINSHFNTVKLLNNVYQNLKISYSQNSHSEKLLFLAEAENSLDHIQKYAVPLKNVQILKNRLINDTQNNLKHFFLPQMLQELETVLINESKSPQELFYALKIYLMLGDSTKLSSQEVIHWFTQTWQKENRLDSDKIALINQSLLQPYQPQTLNYNLINNVRNYLCALPENYLYYSLLKQYFPQTEEQFEIPGLHLVKNTIPKHLTRGEFHNIIDILPQLSLQLKQDSWVLNRNISENITELLLKTYCQEYASFWKNILKKVKTYSFHTYSQGHQLLSLLSNNNSFIKLLNQIQTHTAPETERNIQFFNSEIAAKFTDINLISASQINELTVNLKELDKFLLTLSMINDDGESAFRVTKSRFQEENINTPLSILFKRSEQVIEPIAGIINQIATDTWAMLINESKNFINKKWNTTVYSQYSRSIATHYPFAKSAADLQINEFEQFFAPHGTFNNFVNYYIAPFLDMSQAKWRPKSLNNFVLPFREEILQEIIRANVITTMFFPGKSSKSKINFTLHKINLDPIIANLEIAIGSNAFFDDHETEGYTRFEWPERDVTIKLTVNDGNYYTLEEAGHWALFRLLEKSNVYNDPHDPSNLNVLFDVNGTIARYSLKTLNAINPFTPGILSDFRLKEVIV